MNFETSSDLPFQMRGGDDRETALYNRIAAINRINYLVQQKIPAFDLRQKSKEYMMCMDMELWKKYYQGLPKDLKIDEDFCQRAASVCMDMENQPGQAIEFGSKIETAVEQIFKSVYTNPVGEGGFLTKLRKKLRL